MSSNYANVAKSARPQRTGEKGQGLVEYSLILVLVAVVVMVILVMLGPAVGNVFSNVITNLKGNTVAGSGGSGNPTSAPAPTAVPTVAPTATPGSYVLHFNCSSSGSVDVKGMSAGTPNAPTFTCPANSAITYTLTGYSSGAVLQFRDTYPGYSVLYNFTVP